MEDFEDFGMDPNRERRASLTVVIGVILAAVLIATLCLMKLFNVFPQ